MNSRGTGPDWFGQMWKVSIARGAGGRRPGGRGVRRPYSRGRRRAGMRPAGAAARGRGHTSVADGAGLA